MLIHVGVVNEKFKSLVRRDEVVSLHAASRTRTHELTTDPEAAEIILLAGDLESLAQAERHELIRRYPEKTFGYSEVDVVLPFLPGVYGSAAKPRALELRRVQSSTYFSLYGSCKNPEVRPRPRVEKELLFSFLGRKNSRVRVRLLEQAWKRADVLVAESSGSMHWQTGLVSDEEAQKTFTDTMARSHFALCPRGMGFGSMRLFEAMMMGIAPVLLADRYALPPGPDWDSFLLQCPESEIARLPELLLAHKAESAERGQRAQAAWRQFFAPDVVFDQVVEQMCDIRRRRVLPEKLYRKFWPCLQWRRNARHAATHMLGRQLDIQF